MSNHKRRGRKAKKERQERAKIFQSQREAGVTPGIRQYWTENRWIKR
jgi:hypothetical protein